MEKQMTLEESSYVIIKKTSTKTYIACCPKCYEPLSEFGRKGDGKLKCKNDDCKNDKMYIKDRIEWVEYKEDKEKVL